VEPEEITKLAGTGTVQSSMRDATLANGAYNIRTATAAASLVISSGSTFGTLDGETHLIYVYLIDNAGTLELSASKALFNVNTTVSTTAEGGAGAADSAIVMYSTTARSNVSARLIGRLVSTQTTAGTWASVPTEIHLEPISHVAVQSEIRLHTQNGNGSTNTTIRRWTTVVSNIGDAMTLTQSAANGDSVTINEAGCYTISYTDLADAATSFGISKNSSELTTALAGITAADRLSMEQTDAGGSAGFCSWAGLLQVGDVIRPHTDGGASSASVRANFTVTYLGPGAI